VEDIFKSLVFDVIVKEVIRRLFLAVPILGFGPLGILTTELITRFAKMFYDYQKELITFYKFEFISETNQKAFDKELENLKKLEQENASEEEKQKALDLAKRRMAFLVRYSLP